MYKLSMVQEVRRSFCHWRNADKPKSKLWLLKRRGYGPIAMKSAIMAVGFSFEGDKFVCIGTTPRGSGRTSKGNGSLKN